MRPNIHELLDGINKTIMSKAIPIVQRSGDMDALWELATGTRVMAFIMDRWKDEFSRLAREIMAMEAILKDAIVALKSIEHPLADELVAIVECACCNISALPSVGDLEERNEDLKWGMDMFIISHSEMPEGGSEDLNAVRNKFRAFLKDVTARDFEAAQKVLFTM